MAARWKTAPPSGLFLILHFSGIETHWLDLTMMDLRKNCHNQAMGYTEATSIHADQDGIRVTTAKLITADELLCMPYDGYRYELLEGKLVKLAPASREHGRYAMHIGASLWQHVDAHQLGEVSAAETGFRLASNPDTVRAPDAAFVSVARVQEVRQETGYWPFAPDLAVEVVSPNDTYTEVESKALQWLDAGTRAVVVVDPRRQSVTVYRSRSDIVILTGDEVLEILDVVPGWTLPLRELFG